MRAALQELRYLVPLKIHQNECNADDDQGDKIPTVIHKEQLRHLEEINVDASEFIYRLKQDRLSRPLKITPITYPETTQKGITVYKPREKSRK
jgi:hypothetical protein